MQQRYLYMRPALQPSEAVLLPALPRLRRSEWIATEPVQPLKDDTFVPVTGDWNGQTTALSTMVRSGGSMAGRGVLRAAGVSDSPFVQRARPRYYMNTSRRSTRMERRSGRQ